MKEEAVGQIAAIVTLDAARAAGGAPIVVARDEEEQQRVALLLSRLLDAVAHDLGNGIYVLIKY